MTDRERIELERKVNNTTDVQEACQLGWLAGYQEGCEESRKILKRMKNELCYMCGKYMTEHLGSCGGCVWKKYED